MLFQANEVEVVIDIRDIELTNATSGSAGGMNENGFVIYIHKPIIYSAHKR
ncbi:hypothetical protein Syun_014581 [Stephania yunnanensis]|uniref:Uncharacterized protein n=1 Tax=Stephania yunnanensis TaxID=152371 RepID=A0AAP0PC28_9MAGN